MKDELDLYLETLAKWEKDEREWKWVADLIDRWAFRVIMFGVITGQILYFTVRALM